MVQAKISGKETRRVIMCVLNLKKLSKREQIKGKLGNEFTIGLPTPVWSRGRPRVPHGKQVVLAH